MNNYISYKIKNISFILTILVVILHAYNIPDELPTNAGYFIQRYISYGIATIAVPIFFIISGFLFFYNFESTINNWIKKYKSRFKSLFIPYMIWCTLWIVVLYLIQLIPFGKSLFSNMILSEFSIKKIIEYTYVNPIPFQLWYIADLIKCVIVSPVIYYLVKKIGKVSGPILIILWFFRILEFSISLFSLGAFIAINNIQFNVKVKKTTYIIIAIIFLSLNFIKIYFSSSQSVYLDMLSQIVIILGMISIWIGYDQYSIKLNSFFDITKYSFFIYLCHEPLQSVIIRILLKLLSNIYMKYMIVYVISPILTIFICIVIAKFLDKYMNKLYKILTGGR